MAPPLFGKLAFVTGAGSGIGRAVCLTLARDGAKVIAADVNLTAANETARALGADSTAFKLDVSSADDVAKALSTTIDKFKRTPAIIVNCAGIIRDSYMLRMTDEDFDEVCGVNLRGTFLMTRYFAQSMVQYKVNGSIINISSIVSKLNSIGQANYAASKAGVNSLTQVCAKEFGKFNIRVNAILPGYIDTPMVKAIPDEAKTYAIKRCPLGRLGKPEEVAEVVSFLASEKSSYVNGALIKVTGGLS